MKMIGTFDFSNEQFYFTVVGCLGFVVFILGTFYFAVIHKFQKGPIFKKQVTIFIDSFTTQF